MNKHTPGPWKLTKNKEFIISTSGEEICSPTGSTNRQMLANANLIIEAPELLKSLKEIIALSDRNNDAYNKAKAVIARAEGN